MRRNSEKRKGSEWKLFFLLLLLMKPLLLSFILIQSCSIGSYSIEFLVWGKDVLNTHIQYTIKILSLECGMSVDFCCCYCFFFFQIGRHVRPRSLTVEAAQTNVCLCPGAVTERRTVIMERMRNTVLPVRRWGSGEANYKEDIFIG